MQELEQQLAEQKEAQRFLKHVGLFIIIAAAVATGNLISNWIMLLGTAKALETNTVTVNFEDVIKDVEKDTQKRQREWRCEYLDALYKSQPTTKNKAKRDQACRRGVLTIE